jgi:hypothetical protein
MPDEIGRIGLSFRSDKLVSSFEVILKDKWQAEPCAMNPTVPQRLIDQSTPAARMNYHNLSG